MSKDDLYIFIVKPIYQYYSILEIKNQTLFLLAYYYFQYFTIFLLSLFMYILIYLYQRQVFAFAKFSLSPLFPSNQSVYITASRSFYKSELQKQIDKEPRSCLKHISTKRHMFLQLITLYYKLVIIFSLMPILSRLKKT